MKKYGKYETRPEGTPAKQPKAKSMLLQTYLTSLLCMVLCVTMFFGTSYAWFTSEVVNEGNEIYIGILDVDLLLGGNSLKDNSTDKVFGNTIFWEPGYTALRTLTVKNKGNLAFRYELTLKEDANSQLDGMALNDVAKWFDVWCYHDDSNGVPTPANYDEIVAGENWIKVGSLDEVLAGKVVFRGSMTEAEVTADTAVSHTYTIALHMNDNATNAVMGKKIGLNVKLSAYQMGSEQDGFGSADYDDFQFVSTMEELQEALKNAKSGEKIFVAPGTYELSEALVLPSNITLYGAQAGKAAKDWVNDPAAAKTVIKSTGSNVLEILQSSEDPAEATANITIDGIMIDCSSCTPDENGVRGIYVKKSGGEAIEGVKIVNCAVVNSANNGIDVCNTYGAVIENNYVSNVTDTAIHLGNYNGYHYETWAEVTAYVRNNVIEKVTETVNGAITVNTGMGDVVVSGNVIKNVTAGDPVGSSDVKASAILVYDVYEGGEILIEKNTIESADQGIAIYKYTYNTVMGEGWWNGPTSDNDLVTVSGNTISGFKTFGIATSELNDANNDETRTSVVINGNTLTSDTSENAISTDGTGIVTTTNNTFNDNSL